MTVTNTTTIVIDGVVKVQKLDNAHITVKANSKALYKETQKVNQTLY